MEEKKPNTQLSTVDEAPQFSLIFADDSEQMRKIAEHKAWLQRIRHERPNPAHHFKVAVYIRYFNQTKHENYLDYHIKQFEDTLALCANWEFVGFYIDEGSTPPNMESAPEWCRLLDDCMEGKVDLIITQKVSNWLRVLPDSFCRCRTLLCSSSGISAHRLRVFSAMAVPPFP